MTTCSTASKTLSQEVRKASAVSFHDSRRAQRAQKSIIGFGQCAFAVAPGNFFDSHNAAAATVDAPHGVQKEDEKTPQGNELKAPFRELIVTGRRQMAARADCGRTLARSHHHFDTFLVGTEVGVLVDKTSETDGSGLES